MPAADGFERPVPPFPAVSAEPRVSEASVVAPAVRVPSVAPPTALNCPAIVLDEVTERSVVVAEMVLIPANCDVDEAKMPLCAQIGVEVAEVLTPKLDAGVNGHANTNALVR